MAKANIRYEQTLQHIQYLLKLFNNEKKKEKDVAELRRRMSCYASSG